VRLRVDCREPREGKADADDQRLRRPGRDGPIIEAATIAEAVSGRIEADERCDQNVRIDGLALDGNGNVPDAAGHAVTWRPSSKLEGAPLLHDDRKRQSCSLFTHPCQEGSGIVLAPEGPVEADQDA
jgi:hypothetical protein